MMNASTKDRILDTAERLFAEHGFDGTSLRQIITEAGVNLAAVHYHFRSKDALLDAILLRKLTPVNAERLGLLSRFEQEAGRKPVPIEKVLQAFIAPTFGVASRHPQFVKLMGRVQGEGMMLRLMGEHFQDVVDRFVAAFRRAVPELSAADLNWRIHFAIGAMAHALRSSPVLPAPPLGADEVSERLVDFLAAGFRARVPAHEEK